MSLSTDLDIKGALIGSSRKFRKEVLTMGIIALENSLKHMTLRQGIQGEEVVGMLKVGAQIRPYRTAKDATGSVSLTPRTLTTYLGDIVEEFDPYAIYETCFGESHTKKRTELEIVKAICVEMSYQCNQSLDQALFSGVRDSSGTTTMDLFNGFDTIITAEKATTPTGESYANISTGKGNLFALGELTSANIGDKLLEFYRASSKVFRTKAQVKMFLPMDLLDMYDDWFAANFDSVLLNPESERRYLHRSGKRVELVALQGMDNAQHIILTTKKNMLVGCDQISAKEKFEINKCDNPKVVQFFMTMYFGVQFECIEKEEFMCGSFSLPAEGSSEEPATVVEPSITVEGLNTLSLEAAVNGTDSDNIIVKGTGITGPLTVLVTGAGFSSSVSEITAAEANAAAGKSVPITYAPTASSQTSATVRILDVTDQIVKEYQITGTISE